MSRFIAFLLLVPSLALCQHVQKIIVRFEPSIVTAEEAEEIGKFAAFKHREETGHKARVTEVKAFSGSRPDLSDWSLREDRFDYLYTRFYRFRNYTSTIVIASPVTQGGKEGSAGAAYECDRHGGVAVVFLTPSASVDQAALIATHELGHILGSPHSPPFFEDIMHVDAQRVYFNKFGGFFRETYDFEDSDFYTRWFGQCRKLSSAYRLPTARKLHVCR